MISRFQAGMKKRSCCSGVAWVRRVGRNMPRWRSRGSGRPRWTKLWRIVMGWEREGNVMGGKQAWGFMVEIQEETKRKKKWFMCQSEFSKCILESQSTVLFTGLSNKKLHSLWNKHAAAHFFVIMQKVHLQHSFLMHYYCLKKRMNPNQKMDQTLWFEHQSIPKFNGLRHAAENVSDCWRCDMAECSVLSSKYRNSIFFFFIGHVLKVDPGGSPSLFS